MNANYDYLLRLMEFKNIDLPLQGIYFIQMRIESPYNTSQKVSIVPYSTSCPIEQRDFPISMHNLFPPQIAADDSMQSKGFLIRYSDEHVLFTDAFRISVKDNLNFVGDHSKVRLSNGSSFGEHALKLTIELLFSNAAECGGLDAIIRTPENANFPIEYTVVATQNFTLSQSTASEYFRSPLALLREHASLDEEEEERARGEIFPCSYVEGILCSSLVKVELSNSAFSTSLMTFIMSKSVEVCCSTQWSTQYPLSWKFIPWK